MSQQFINHLRTEINANARNWHTNNWPSGDKGPEPNIELYPEFRRIASRVRRNAFAAALPGLYRGRLRLLAREGVLFLFPALIYKRRVNTYADIAYLYDLLANDESRGLLVKLLAYRIMGHKRVRLPRNTPVHDEYIKKVGHLPVVGPALSVNFMNLTLELRDLSSIDFNLRAYCTSGGGSYVFLQRQYEYHCRDVRCKAEAGDIVVDAGACWGETSLYFAHEVGAAGRVFSFEFIPSNLEVLGKNISENHGLADRITVIEKPVWSESDRTLYYVDWGPGSRVSFAKLREDFADTQCQTTTIDEMASKRNLPRLDMIKMDIEGAELAALKGAERCIRQYQPKLAISLYHNIEDFSTIPRYLDSLDVPYKYYLDHHTIYENETVLFAVPQRRRTGEGGLKSKPSTTRG
jgi:FkbM family methyltransferase